MSHTENRSLEDMLDHWFVMSPGQWTNDQGPAYWYAVGNNDEGLVGYFMREEDAFRFRLAEINRELNG